jgi:DNA end-binding protein Ku
MARAIWTGSLSFGLVNVPVGVYAATEDKTIHFNQLERGTSDRIRMRRVNERTGEEVSLDEIVKGYDLGGGRYVVVEPGELEAVEPGRSNTIEIRDFVDLSEIDPVFYKSAYYLAPKGRDPGRAYALLRQAMAEANKVGIATFVMRGKQHLVAIRPDRQVLTLETMYFADEVRDPATELDTLPSTELEFTGREVDTAKLLIEAMAADWDPMQYRDTYRDAVEELVDRKSRGETVVSERPAEPVAPVVDLMEALRASVEQVREGRASTKAAPKARAARKPATAAAAKPATGTRKSAGKVTVARKTAGKAARASARDEAEAEAERKPARRKAS